MLAHLTAFYSGAHTLFPRAMPHAIVDVCKMLGTICAWYTNANRPEPFIGVPLTETIRVPMHRYTIVVTKKAVRQTVDVLQRDGSGREFRSALAYAVEAYLNSKCAAPSIQRTASQVLESANPEALLLDPWHFVLFGDAEARAYLSERYVHLHACTGVLAVDFLHAVAAGGYRAISLMARAHNSHIRKP